MNKLQPLKRFGQNFLRDQNIIRKIISEIAPQKADTIIEIGPGEGALTGHLFNKVDNLYAVEIDKRVIDDLKQKFPGLNLIQKDFLEFDINSISKPLSSKVRIAGNIPYNITSPILFKLFENNIIIEDAVFMVQLEVAKRISAKMGSKDYGILSVLINYFGSCDLAFKVSRNVFYPKPNVDSAVIHIRFNDKRKNPKFNSTFVSVVKSAFGNRRKTLKNSLSNSIFAGVNFLHCKLDLSLRAEQLTVEDFIELTQYLLDKSNP